MPTFVALAPHLPYAGGQVWNNVFHATLLHLLGFNHERHTYGHGGRDFRLTDVRGKVAGGVLA